MARPAADTARRIAMITRTIPSVFGSTLLVVLFACGASAQQRTFVSGLGSDSNPCSRTAPCRTFTQAVSQTGTGGEVIVLDSAGYGPFTITSAISIIAPPGVYAGISVSSGDGIDINAGASDTIILRGLTVNNQGSTGSGIFFLTGGTLHVESCVVNGFSDGSGVYHGGADLEVKDSIMRGNSEGIRVQPSFETGVATIDRVRLEGNTGFGGLFVLDGSTVVVRNSVASDNQFYGFLAWAFDGGPVELNVENCLAFNNVLTGIVSLGATIRVSNSTVTDNGTGLGNDLGGFLASRGNNTVEANGTDTSGTIGSYTAK
jgi:hypothetical protein